MLVARRLMVGCVVSLAGVGAAGAPAWGSGEPAPVELLAEAAERSAAVASRFEMFLEMDGLGTGLGDQPLATGMIDGTASHIVMDLEDLMASAADEFGDIDWTMEMIALGKLLYIRAPMFAEIAGLLGDDAGPLAVFGEIGDGWGSVDVGSLDGVSAEQASSMLGGVGGSPSTFYAALATTSKLTPIGTADVNGVNSSGYEAMIDLGALLAAQGGDAGATAGVDPAALAGMQFPIEVWLGDDGYIRRMAFELDGDALAASATAAGQDPEEVAGLADGAMRMQIDSFDFADPSIVIEAPAGAIDITAEYAELIELSSRQ